MCVYSAHYMDKHKSVCPEHTHTYSHCDVGGAVLLECPHHEQDTTLQTNMGIYR